MSVDIETPLRRTWALSHLDMRDMCAAGLVHQVVGWGLFGAKPHAERSTSANHLRDSARPCDRWGKTGLPALVSCACLMMVILLSFCCRVNDVHFSSGELM